MDQEHSYRAYLIGRSGHILRRVDLLCADDEASKARAKPHTAGDADPLPAERGKPLRAFGYGHLVDGHAVELWDAGRMVAVFKPE